MTAITPRLHTAVVITGNSQANTFDGSVNDDLLDGGGGDDTLNGDLGNDTLIGGDGADTLNGGDGDDSFDADGSDTVDGGDGYDTALVDLSEWAGGGISLDLTDISGSAPVALVTGGSLRNLEVIGLIATGANDTIITPGGGGEFYGAGGDDVISITSDVPASGPSVLMGGAGNDQLTAGFSQDWLFGGEGDDTIDGGFGNDHIGAVDDFLAIIASADTASTFGMIGGEGTPALQDQSDLGADHLDGSFGDDVIYGWGGNDTLIGGIGTDSLFGGDGQDVLNGFEGGSNTESDVLNGQAGDDVINADAYDQVDGGDGKDILNLDFAYYNLTGAPLVLDLSSAMNGGQIDFAAGGSARNVESIHVWATDSADVISDAAWDGELHGGNGDDQLNGNDGNDLLDGGAGMDTLRGGAGNDTYIVDASDKILESNNQGIDTVIAGMSYALGGRYLENLTLTGTGNFNASGNGLVNVLTGNSGNNTLNGGFGADTMLGGAGNDAYFVDNRGDAVIENADEGKDTVFALVSYTLGDNVESLALIGYQALNATGNALANVLAGNGNVNRLDGGDGKDILSGNGGNDILTGGADADQFRFARAGQPNGLDHITDFLSGIDKLVFTGSDYGFAKGHVLTAEELHGGGSVGTGGQFLYNTINHTLYWDADGTGSTTPIGIAVFDNAATLATGDFAFV